MTEARTGIDPRLHGEWRTALGDRYSITPTGQVSIVGASPFAISPDGRSMTYPAGQPADTFLRIHGVGSELEGVWRRPGATGPKESPEELHFRSDGTFSNHYIEEGVVSDFNGSYRVQGNSLRTSQVYLMIATGPNATILLARPGRMPQAETYAFSNGASRVTISDGPDVIEFTRGPASGSHSD